MTPQEWRDQHREQAPDRRERRTANLRADDGLSERDVKQRVRDGRLVRLRRGVLTDRTAETPVQRHLQLARAVALQRSEPVFSHVTAAVAWGLPVNSRNLDRVWLTRRRGHGHGRTVPDAVESQSSLRAEEIAVASGLVVTSVARTVVDLGRTSALEWGVAAADAALHRGLCTRDDLEAAVAAGRGRRGIARAARAVAFADPRAESPLESVSRLTISRTDLPQPVLQHPIVLAGRKVATSDFAWLDEKVVGECDGAVKYGALLADGQSAQDAVLAEKRREELIREAGWWVVRWDWKTAWDRQRLAQRLRSALGFQSLGPAARSA
nr:hypothetical protein [Propionibacterium sp.]